jgi:hypothetical protein
MKCAACPLRGESRACYAEASGSPGLCAMVATHADFPALVRRLSLEPPVRLESVTSDPAEAARLRRAAKPRVPKDCKPCHGKPPDQSPDGPG